MRQTTETNQDSITKNDIGEFEKTVFEMGQTEGEMDKEGTRLVKDRPAKEK